VIGERLLDPLTDGDLDLAVGDGDRTLVSLKGDGELVAEPVPRQAARGIRQLGGERQKAFWIERR
jgi:hypothetical protein